MDYIFLPKLRKADSAATKQSKQLFLIPQLHGAVYLNTRKYLDTTANTLRPPAPTEIRLIYNLGLAYGVKGFLPFPYGVDPAVDENGDAVSFDGLVSWKKHNIYYMNHWSNFDSIYGKSIWTGYQEKWSEDSSLNYRLMQIGDTILSFSSWIGAASWSTTPNQTSAWDQIVTTVATTDTFGNPDIQPYVEVGHLQNGGGTDYIIVVNRRTANQDTRNISITLNSKYSWWTITDIESNNEWMIPGDSTFTDRLLPGQGKIYRLNSRTPFTTADSTATAFSNQRKIVTYGGVTHAVYQLNGSIVYSRNDGSGWIPEVPIRVSATAKNPSIAANSTNSGGEWNTKISGDGTMSQKESPRTINTISGCVYIVWEETRYDLIYGGTGQVVMFVRSTDRGLSWGTPTALRTPLDTLTAYGVDATPVVSCSGSSAIVSWRYHLSTGEGGIVVWPDPLSGKAPVGVPATNPNSASPAITGYPGPLAVTWVQGNDSIMYREFTIPGDVVTYSPTYSDLSQQYGYMTWCKNPTIATAGSSNHVFVAWEADSLGVHEIFLREKTSAGWQPVISFKHGTDYVKNPTLGIDSNMNKVNLFWEFGSHIAKQSRPVIGGPLWSSLIDRGTGVCPSIEQFGSSHAMGIWIGAGTNAPYPVSFNDVNPSVYTVQSYTPDATGSNSQRKVVRGRSRELCMTYESEGDIWAVRSLDSGKTWYWVNYLSMGMNNCSYPAITERSDTIYAVWQSLVSSGVYNIVYNYSMDSGKTWQSTPITLVSSISCPSPGPMPVIMAGTPTNAFDMLIAYRTSSTIMTKHSTMNPPPSGSWSSYSVTEAGGTSENPSLVYRPNSFPFFSITWDDGNSTFYNDFYNTNWSPETSVTGWLTGHGVYSTINSSYAVSQNGDKQIATVGTAGGFGVVIHTKNLSQSVFTEFYTNYTNYYRPVITGDSAGRATILWYKSGNIIYKSTYSGSAWNTPTSFGSNDAYPTVSINNPPGGTAFAFWTQWASAPYSIVTSSNGGPLQKSSSPWTYKRRVMIASTDTSVNITVELTPPILVTPDGKQMNLTFTTVDDAVNYTADNAWSAFQTEGFSLPSGVTQGTVLANRSINMKGKLSSTPLAFEIDDAGTGSVLSQQVVQGTATGTTGPTSNLLELAFQAQSGEQLMLRVHPTLTLGGGYTTGIGHCYEENDSSALSKYSAAHLGLYPLPKEYALQVNYPNPFNPTTTIQYQLPADSRVKLDVYNILGQLVATLVNETQSAGYKQIGWNASNFASGVYFYRLDAVSVTDPSKNFTQVRKMLLIK